MAGRDNEREEKERRRGGNKNEERIKEAGRGKLRGGKTGERRGEGMGGKEKKGGGGEGLRRGKTNSESQHFITVVTEEESFYATEKNDK